MAKRITLFFLLIGLTTSLLAAQGTGRLTGTVYENYCRTLTEDVTGAGRTAFGERGAAGVTLYLYSENYVAATETDADGAYLLTEVPAGTYTLGAFVRNYGMARVPVRIQAEATGAVDLRLPFAAPGEMLVAFVAGTPPEEIDALNEAFSIVEARLISPTQNLYALRIPENNYLPDYMDAYRRQPIVRDVTFDYILCPLD